MADEVENTLITTEAGRRWAFIFGGISTVYFMALIALVTFYGRENATLLIASLNMAFVGIYIVLAGLGFGAALSLGGQLINKK